MTHKVLLEIGHTVWLIQQNIMNKNIINVIMSKC